MEYKVTYNLNGLTMSVNVIADSVSEAVQLAGNHIVDITGYDVDVNPNYTIYIQRIQQT